MRTHIHLLLIFKTQSYIHMELSCECDIRFLGNAFWDFLMFKSVIM